MLYKESRIPNACLRNISLTTFFAYDTPTLLLPYSYSTFSMASPERHLAYEVETDVLQWI